MSGYRYPAITAGDLPGQMVQLKGYLKQLVDQLNQEASASRPAPSSGGVIGSSKTNQSTGAASFDEIKSLVIKSAEVVSAVGNAVIKRLEGQYVAQSEYGTYTQDTAAAFAASDRQIAALLESVEQISTGLSDLEGSTLEQLARIQATAGEVSIWMQKVKTDGVEKVVTGMGHSFTDEGLRIRALNSEIENLLTNKGMFVTAGEDSVLQADPSGVNAINVTARQYFTAGTHARFEDYGQGRTGCFFVGGNA